MEQNNTESRLAILKNFYFYVVSFVALMMVVFSVANIIDVALKTYVFTKAENNYYSYPVPACDSTVVDPAVKKLPAEDCAKSQAETEKRQKDENTAQKQRDLVRDISFLIVGIPLFWLHWSYLRRNKTV